MATAAGQLIGVFMASFHSDSERKADASNSLQTQTDEYLQIQAAAPCSFLLIWINQSIAQLVDRHLEDHGYVRLSRDAIGSPRLTTNLCNRSSTEPRSFAAGYHR
jgi:hypothetical protein